MNRRLNSEAASRKILRTVDFGTQGSAPGATSDIAQRADAALKGVLPRWSMNFRNLPVDELVHDLNQALHDAGESGALELRADLRRTCLQ